jgi:diguanylate cyclase (GGDEF)-like protein/PAS domain S-box-containing protein
VRKVSKKIMPYHVAKKHDAYLKRYNKTHVPHIIGMGRAVVAQKKGGELVHVFLSISETKVCDQTFYIGIMNDITEEQRLREQNQKLIEFNCAVIKEVGKTPDYQDLISNILSIFAKLFKFDVGHFYAYEHHQNVLVSSHIFFRSHARKYQPFINLTKKISFKKSEGLPGSAWKKNTVVYYKNINTAKNFPRKAMIKGSFPLRSALALPVKYKNNFFGVIEFFTEQELLFSQEELTLFEDFSEIISGLYGQYKERHLLSLLLNNCAEGVYGLDTKGITTFVNPRACKILGYTPEELIGKSMHEKIHHSFSDGSPYPRDDCYIYRCINENNPSYVEHEVFWAKKGLPIPIEYNVTPILENQKTVGGVVTFLDMSEKIRIQHILKAVSILENLYIKGEKKAPLFNKMLSLLLELTESEYGFIGGILKDSNGTPYIKTHAITNIAWGKASKKIYNKHKKDGLEFTNLYSLFDDTIRTGKVVISNHPKDDKRRGCPSKEEPTLTKYLGIPIIGANGQLIAMYGLANPSKSYSKALITELQPLTLAITNILESFYHYATIKKMAEFDSLTGLFNRQQADLKLQEEITLHRKKKTSFHMLLLDLNNFKRINDTYGHQVGDILLIELGRRILSTIKNKGFAAHLGGDEFIVILTDEHDLTSVEKITRKLMRSSHVPYVIQDKSIQCDLSIGISTYPAAGENINDLLKHANFTLSCAKKNQPRISFYSVQIKKQFEAIQELENDVYTAFQEKKFFLMYQPQVHLETQEIVGIEALLRFKHPTKGAIPPDQFIPILEKFGYSEQLNTYVLNEALNQIQSLHIKKPLKVAINISPNITNLKNHLRDLMNIVQSNQILIQNSKIHLEFEITESSFAAPSKHTLSHALHQTKKAGISWAIDDFGVEYSSMNRLIQYPFDTVKIDRYFIKKLDGRNKKAAMTVIRALVQMAKELNFTLIAEGAETKEQVECLIKLGCHYVQGFYFYKPLDFDEIKSNLMN